MKTNRSKKLSEVNHALFDTFGQLEYVDIHKVDNDGSIHSISICPILNLPEYGPHTLTYYEFTCPEGRFNSNTFAVYNRPVDRDSFDTEDYVPHFDPILSISFFAKYPQSKMSTAKMDWIRGRGFWIREDLRLQYGGPAECDFSISAICEGEQDTSFPLVVDTQHLLKELKKEIHIHGHWECEWKKQHYATKPDRIP